MTLDRLFQIVRLRLRSLLRGTAVDRELDEELRDHIERQVEEHIARGVRPEEARTLALRALGGVEQRKEEMRDARGVSVIEYLINDLRLALRQLRKQPAFAATAILSLALGIGANTAIFQLLNAIAFRPLPVRAPHELVEVRLEGGGRYGRHTGRNEQLSQPQWIELQRRQEAFATMLAFGDTRFNLAESGEVRYVEGVWVSGTFFDALGVVPQIGRLIGPADDRPKCGYPGAVISHALWQREFGGRPDVLQHTIPFDGHQVPIIGVTPPSFFGVEVGRQFDVAMPLCSSGFELRNHWWLAAIGRLKPAWTREQAQAHVQGLLPGIQRDTVPATYRPEEVDTYVAMRADLRHARAGVSPLREWYRQPLWILMVIAALVLLIASVNLANLLLSRAIARQQEFSVRLAIGGSRIRVLQQVLVESIVLAALGWAAALAVTFTVSQSIVSLISTAVNPIYLDLSIDWRMFGFTALVAATAAAMAGLAPALRASRATAFRPGQRGTTAPRGAQAGRRVLVSLQVAMTLVLLFGALLFLRSFRNLATQDLGVRQDGVVIANVFFPPSAFPEQKRVLAYTDLEDRLRALPGVTGLAEALTTPIGGNFSDRDIRVDAENKGNSYRNVVSADYFDVLGTPLVAGRDFDARDVAGAPLVAIVNEAFVQRFLDGGDVLGRRIGSINGVNEPDTVYEIIGVVRNQKYNDIRESFPPIMFPASSQVPPALIRRYVVRSTATAAQAIGAIGGTLNAIDPKITVRYARLSTQVSDALAQERLMARLAVLFGIVALSLAVVGLYGLVSYSVATRRAEIGMRVALGATRSGILAMILGDVGRMMIAGVLAGSALALLASGGVGSLLFGLEPTDLATLAIAGAALVLTGLVAALLPARRAAGIDPLTALREQ
jgi:putative ABC transport system permease protein